MSANQAGSKWEAVFTPAHFDHIRQLAYEVFGFSVQDGKEELIRSRLMRRLRDLDLPDFDTYFRHLEADRSGGELLRLVDALTTNKTNFFREPAHFDFLRQHILPQAARQGRRLRLWSAACSSGEEPYSISMLLKKSLPDLASWDVKILATDISDTVLATAKKGVYADVLVQEIPPELAAGCLEKQGDRPPHTYRVNDAVRRPIHFARLNLMGNWPMQGPFQVIFCRNVMIYFDKPTKEKLVSRFYDLLPPGGYLFIGHAESLSGMDHPFGYVQPAVYVRE